MATAEAVATAVDEPAPRQLEPSELGTRSYWDEYYQNDLDHDESEGDEATALSSHTDLESWFDDVGAPAKVLQYLTSEAFPLASRKTSCTVLDLGTGNGSSLFSLFIDGGYTGCLVGIDYSQQSIELANKLHARYSRLFATPQHRPPPISFHVFDMVTDDPLIATWWPEDGEGFDLVLDKGTFDAVSLSSETVVDSQGVDKRLCEIYPGKTAALVRKGGFFLITSCNWTEEEVIDWFTTGEMQDQFEVFGKIKYKTFQFGGHKGQGVSTVCFRKPD
ncbi:Protein-lysine N-methyltransferase EFM4 [Cyphellophora attinorum]|uniref:Protein-lysine N-methyltransferase EFM4 n=1 Tax=Cyphellophora attinorum TaxID=1664694 RepID=A0A0N1NYD8_9EURO|nr:Protein-lysine N-methyltransferase EFM4 [Phialophora attinorum]KPI36983.1 Protein-lysine N-methyltransferase EFM4 [Phialophora attinorum]